MTNTLITLDFETRWGNGYSLTNMTYPEYIRHKKFHVFGVGIKINDEDTYYISDFQDIKSHLEAILPPDNTVTLVCQNTMFDVAILNLHYNLPPPNRYVDTQSMSPILWPGVSASLKNIAERLGLPPKGNEVMNTRNKDFLTTEEQKLLGEYCINDVDITYKAYQMMLPYIPDVEMDLIHITQRMYNEPKLVLDVARTEATHQWEIDNRKNIIEKSGVPQHTLASNVKFAALLEQHHIEVPTKVSPNTGKVTHALANGDLAYQHLVTDNPAFEHLWEARRAVKSRLNETRAKRFLDSCYPDTNLMPVPLKYYGAKTGRYSATQKINMQNLPARGKSRELRNALMTPDGYKLIVADSSQIEARVVAWLAGQKDIVNTFARGEDVYKKAASGVYRKPVDQITKQERFVGKTCTLGLGYGAGWRKFRDILRTGAMGPKMELTETEAQDIVYGWRDANVHIVQLWRDLDAIIEGMHFKDTDMLFKDLITVKYQRLITPGGLQLWYPGLHTNEDSETFYSGKTKIYGGKLAENITQHLARNIVMQQLVDIDALPDTTVVSTVHDEVIAVVPEDLAEKRLQQSIDIMSQPPTWAPDLPLAAEGDIADNYGDAK